MGVRIVRQDLIKADPTVASSVTSCKGTYYRHGKLNSEGPGRAKTAGSCDGEITTPSAGAFRQAPENIIARQWGQRQCLEAPPPRAPGRAHYRERISDGDVRGATPARGAGQRRRRRTTRLAVRNGNLISATSSMRRLQDRGQSQHVVQGNFIGVTSAATKMRQPRHGVPVDQAR